MSGVEVAGLVLAILPLVVNQLDNYARGLETFRTLRRYKWELEACSSTLSAQCAIFLNTLEIFLQDAVDDHDERLDLIKNPTGPGWRKPAFQKALADKLGRDYVAFTGTVTGLCGLLEELSAKLDRQTSDYSRAASFVSLGSIKFRRILSKAVYEGILNKIDKANQILKTISEQSIQLNSTRRKVSRVRKGLKRHRDGRRHARALYDILVEGQGWQCSCRDNHTVCFRLDANTIRRSGTADQSSKTQFLVMLSTFNRAEAHPQTQWHEVELQADALEGTIPLSLMRAPNLSAVAQGKRRVQFATPSSTTVCVESVHQAPINAGTISDLCSTLCGAKIPESSFGHGVIGYMLSQTSDLRYNMRLLRNIAQDFNLYSLSAILSSGPAIRAPTPIQASTELSWRDRLYLATVLVCSILQLHGSWLKQGWGTTDVLFATDPQHGHALLDHPYLVWPVTGPKPQDPSTGGRNRIQNEILLPLAIALIELSLGRIIAALYRVEDESPDESQTRFNTASRVLNKGECFEDSQFDESVFDTVVSPLLKDLDYFEGLINVQ
ncbi:hypothetical protein BJX65DRAFT_305537 [Aspergillus insuetus]